MWTVVALVVLGAVAWALMNLHSGSGSAAPISAMPRIRGDGRYSVEVVGESHHQAAFRAHFGAQRKADDESEVRLDALLRLEDSNPHDKNAVSVSLAGRQVGFLSREMAVQFRDALRRDGLLGWKEFAVGARVYMGGQDELWSVSLDLPET